MRPLKKYSNIFIILILSGFFCELVLAHGENRYQHKMSTSVATHLSWGPNVREVKRGANSFFVKTEKLLTLDTVLTSTTSAIVSGKRRAGDKNVAFELDALIQSGHLETKMSLAQLDGLLFEWEKIYETPSALKSLDQKTKKLLYHEGEGFQCQRLLKRDFDYIAFLDVSVDVDSQRIANRSSDLKLIVRFIKKLEKDKRSRILITSDTSGLPIFVSLREEEGELTFQARFPMHTIEWNRREKFNHYSFISSLEQVGRFPEINRLSRDSSVRDFVSRQKKSVRVNVKGNPTDGFSCVLIGDGIKERLKVGVKGKKISLGKNSYNSK